MNNLTEDQIREIKNELLTKFNPKNYDSLTEHDYIDTIHGEFWLESKPNIYQPVNLRAWIFYHTSDSEGEPMTDGAIISINTEGK